MFIFHNIFRYFFIFANNETCYNNPSPLNSKKLFNFIFLSISGYVVLLLINHFVSDTNIHKTHFLNQE
jgi:hypothetical protein